MAIDASIINNLRPVQIEDPTTMLAKGLAIRGQIQQQQLGAQELQQRQLQIDQTKSLNDAYKGALTVGPDGTPSIDQAKLTQALGQAGHGAAIPGVMKGILDTQKSAAEVAELRGKVSAAEQDFGGTVGAAVKAANYDPHLFLTAAQHAIDAKAVDPNTLAPVMQHVQQLLADDPTGEQARAAVQQISDHLIASSPAQQKLLNEAMTAKGAQQRGDAAALTAPSTVARNTAETANIQAQTPGNTAKSAIETASANALRSMTRADWSAAIDSTIADKTSPLYGRTAAAVNLALNRGDLKGAQQAIKDAGDQLGRTETAVATAKATAPIKIDVATQTAAAKADQAGLTDDDYQRLGEQYARTGVMPAMGRDSITRGKIAHAAQEFARDNGFKPADLVTMQAAYAGDKESLKKFQSQRDQIVSFEQTAQKNLDLFLDAASKIPDTGAPWLNQPLRTLSEKAIGSTNMAAVNAARQVANNEIAKVTSGGSLSGVLSDSARHEVASYNPANATFAQTMAVAKILKQDMANRHQSMDATLGDIKSRIGGGGNAGGGQQYLRLADGPNGHQIGQKADGGWYDIQTGAKVK